MVCNDLTTKSFYENYICSSHISSVIIRLGIMMETFDSIIKREKDANSGKLSRLALVHNGSGKSMCNNLDKIEL